MSEKADELARRARAIREKRALDADPGLREDMAELREEVTMLREGLSNAYAAAGVETVPQRPPLKLIRGEKAG